MPKKSKYPPKREDKSHLVKARQKLNWSDYQKAIFKNIAQDDGHLIVEAYAGTSKTTTLVESFRYLPKGKKTIALAFNKIIQEELQSRAPSYVECLTYHSLGYRAIRQRFGNTIQIDDYKVADIAAKVLPNQGKDVIDNICSTVALCKYGLVDSPAAIDKLMFDFSIDTIDMERKDFIIAVVKILGHDKADTTRIDFNDMCYFPFVYNLPLGQYDFIYVDEFQDTNKSQLVMVKKLCKPGGKIAAFGDPYQDLYSWRMSDYSIIMDLKNEAKAKTLTLPISYRCPKKIIDLAKNWVPDITCPESAIDGDIQDIHLNDLYGMAKPGCFILSRTNAPMIKICMNFIRRGIKANIRGRDVGKHLISIIKKSKKSTVPELIKWLKVWFQEETEKLTAKGFPTDNLADRYECLTTLCDEHSSIDAMCKDINSMFNDVEEKNVIVLSTVHRAKGLERENVFLLRWTFRAWFDGMEHMEKPDEEANIAYVGITRSKCNLFIVHKTLTTV